MNFISILLIAPMMWSKAEPAKQHAYFATPLSSFSSQWDDPKFEACNTAATAGYMSQQEKDVIWILNMARAYPQLFCETVVKKYAEYSLNDELEATTWYKSLVATMTSMKAVNILMPDQGCYNSAECHAYNSGIRGYEGHDRSDECSKKAYYNAECCDYSNDEAIDIVMSLLIDENVESLGHRKICLGQYRKVGVSIQPHIKWQFNTVIDFH